MSKQQLDAILQTSAQFPPPANGSAADVQAWSAAINAQTPILDGAIEAAALARKHLAHSSITRRAPSSICRSRRDACEHQRQFLV
ncbi:hypothetical protein JQ594_17870 [Bradyrhizobium manausense]|uniref:hypothetical protein n=1 Tax=Bradyrhizobium manausense TaxID=989370 RepID=UPI001BA5D10A|nr:hypothetical protein [Bradyrhizobium manausense]MBR0687803.1 hypothetical protein [Bradyrhizobium manausense]